MSRLLPDRHTAVKDSLVAQAARLNRALPEAASVARAWSIASELYPRQPFGRFVLMLDILAALNMIDLRGDVLMKVVPVAAQD